MSTSTLKSSSSSSDLQEGHTYVIEANGYYKYKGIYVRNKGYFLEFKAHKLTYEFDITMLFTPNDTFYNYDKIKEASTKAIQSMESRSLNMILRNIIGDQSFEW